MVGVIEALKKETPQIDFERSSKSERDPSLSKEEAAAQSAAQQQENELMEAAFGYREEAILSDKSFGEPGEDLLDDE